MSHFDWFRIIFIRELIHINPMPRSAKRRKETTFGKKEGAVGETIPMTVNKAMTTPVQASPAISPDAVKTPRLIAV